MIIIIRNCIIFLVLTIGWETLREMSVFLPFLKAILLSSDGQNLVTGGDNGVVEVWQACDFKQLYIYPGCDAGIRAMDLSHDQRWAMRGSVITWEWSWKVLYILPRVKYAVRFQHLDGKKTSSEKGKLRIGVCAVIEDSVKRQTEDKKKTKENRESKNEQAQPKQNYSINTSALIPSPRLSQASLAYMM